MINKAVLIGRLGADPELRYTQSGVGVVSFDIAVQRPYKKGDGSRESDWITIQAWRQLAELCAQYLKKGSQVAIEGRLQTRSYENKEGQLVKVYEVVAENVQFLSGTGDGSGKREDKGNQSDYNGPFADNDKVIDISDEDLPF